MSRYSFSLQNYHAIKEAHIDIDGLTVLAGINGSGKSTLSRWLYYLTNAMHEFEHFQKNEYVNALVRVVNQVARVLRSDNMSSKYDNYREKILAFKKENAFEEAKLVDLFVAFLLQAENDLKKYVTSASPSMIKRLSYYLTGKDDTEEKDINDVVQTYISNINLAFQDRLEVLHKTISSRSLLDLEDVIANEYEQYEGMPKDMSLFEEGFNLFEEGRFTPPIALNKAIYVDSPMVLSEIDYKEDCLWGRFKKLLFETNNATFQTDEKNIQVSIQSIIGGKVKLKKDDIGYSEELHFLANDGVDIRIEEAATGIKSFAYISRLLENGWLDKETLLLIDEPEAHLHPQWIVEFARLLVLIHKELGTKIMIASHNPDMVAAIQSIATKEGVIDRTKFYLAERNKDSLTYSFVDKESEIGDIFESFNIAMSRIEQYGTPLM